jgi:hypothetical protein
MRYATVEQLTAYLGAAAPANAERLLDRASEVITGVIRTAVYDVDSAGAATDPQVVDALARATCAQVEWFLETGDTTGAAGQYTQVSIGNVRLSRGAGNGTAGPAPREAPQAVTILWTAGLLRSTVVAR